MTSDKLQSGGKPARVPVKLPKAKVVARKDITPDLWLIWLEPEVPFTFKPGQYITIGVNDIERPYSIVSAPHEPLIELFIELVPPPIGKLTPPLYELQPGAEVSMRPRAKGIFTMDPQYTNQVFVATVTGIVPYISFLRSYMHRGDSGHNFYILDGASYHDEFAYMDELGNLAATHPDSITYVRTISRAQDERNAGWTGETGRVNTIVETYLKKFNLDIASTQVYTCGHPGMIEDVKERLLPNGWTVKEERFWKED